MKFINSLFLLSCILASPLVAQDNSVSSNSGTTERTLQLGADLIVPYRVSTPDGRTSTLLGAHAEYFLVPDWSFAFQGVFGVDDEGFTDNPVYLAPGMTFYPLAGRIIEPYLRVDVPFLLNANDDFGARAGLGFMWNTGLAGLAVKYSFDGAYFFDSAEVILNLVNVSLAINL